MEIVPLQNFVLLEEIKLENTEGGLILGNDDEKYLTERAKVISCGSEVKLKINAGDIVLFKPYGFEPITIDGKEYRMGREENIFAIIK